MHLRCQALQQSRQTIQFRGHHFVRIAIVFDFFIASSTTHFNLFCQSLYGRTIFYKGFFMTVTALVPRQPTPDLVVPLVNGAQFALKTESVEQFQLIVFYRGLHCPICAKYLIELERLVPEFEKRGVKVLALSSDKLDRAAAMAEKIKATHLRIGYDLSLQNAREWGLYISASKGKTSIDIEEPALFSEPGIFIVRADGTLYYASTQTMPFARPSFQDLVAAVDFAISKNYPARGEYIGSV
jgi:peroxiredoxin